MADTKVKTLIVDDDDDMRLLITTAIEIADHGLHVAGVAAGVADGVAKFWELQPDVLVVDFRMPDGTGVELVRQLREQDASPRVVFCSADLSDEITRSMYDVGACAVLEKDRFGEIPDAIWRCVPD